MGTVLIHTWGEGTTQSDEHPWDIGEFHPCRPSMSRDKMIQTEVNISKESPTNVGNVSEDGVSTIIIGCVAPIPRYIKYTMIMGHIIQTHKSMYLHQYLSGNGVTHTQSSPTMSFGMNEYPCNDTVSIQRHDYQCPLIITMVTIIILNPMTMG